LGPEAAVSVKDDFESYKKLIAAAHWVVFNANDLFARACADAEQVDADYVPMAASLFGEYGWDGLNAFIAWHRNQEPLEELRTAKYREARASIEIPSPTDDDATLWFDHALRRERDRLYEENRRLRELLDRKTGVA
jgi:hypothetical protein